MLDRTARRFNLKPKRLAADTAYGTGRFLGWLVGQGSRLTSRSATRASERMAPSRARLPLGQTAGVYICPNGKVAAYQRHRARRHALLAIAPPSSTAMSVR